MRSGDRMPHQRIFADFDPVLELKKHNTPLISTGRRKVPEKYWPNDFRHSSIEPDGRSSRQKRTANLPPHTTNSVHVSSRSHNTDVGKPPVSKDGRKRQSTLPSNTRQCVDQTQSRKLFISSVRRPRASTSPSELTGGKGESQRKRSGGTEQIKPATAEKQSDGSSGSMLGNQGRSSNLLSNTTRSVNAKAAGNVERKTSASVLRGRYTAMAAIVRARSMAMKWYGGNKKRTGRQKIKAKNVLPTINDATKFSLCTVSCSPQFAETIKLMEGDARGSGDTTCPQIERDLHVLNLD